jgi:uncharacterized protein YbjT (DUF2867 family)
LLKSAPQFCSGEAQKAKTSLLRLVTFCRSCGSGAGNNRLNWISRSDVAAFAVAALDNPAARCATLELGGPEALSPLEVVRIFECAPGKPFETQYVPEEALHQQQAQVVDSVRLSVVALMPDYAKGDVIGMKDALRAFPIRLLSVADYARHVLMSA